MGKAETASRDKNVSGAADSGESRDGGTRAVSLPDSCHIKFRRPMGGADVPLARRPPGEASLPARRESRDVEGADATRDCAQRRRAGGEPEIAKREAPVRREGVRWRRRIGGVRRSLRG